MNLISKLKSTTYIRNTFWRVFLKLANRKEYRLCKPKKVDGEFQYMPVDRFEISHDILDCHDVSSNELVEQKAHAFDVEERRVEENEFEELYCDPMMDGKLNNRSS